MRGTKICLYCKNKFSPIRGNGYAYSKKQFEAIKFCSRSCGAKIGGGLSLVEINKMIFTRRSNNSYKHKEDTKKKISLSLMGHKSWSKGKKHSLETRKKISLSLGGNGISPYTGKISYHLKDWKYKLWRKSVFERDNWTCQTCGARSSEKKPVYLEPHHIKGWVKYPKLRYILNNGITLCRECHKIFKKGR